MDARHRYRYFLIYKPFGMLSQFTADDPSKRTLGELHPFPKDVYPVGRLDEDSEGLLLLTNDPKMNAALLGEGVEKEYWVQVEGIPTEEALAQLRRGVEITVRKKRHRTLPADVRRLAPAPDLPARVPPIRVRLSVPDSWLAITIREGKNRQVRKMVAAVGFPCLRLVRWRFHGMELDDLQPGEVREIAQIQP
jgi:23S rRNA pseudouridine2457 synthase